MATSSPYQFEELTPEVVDCCVEYGAANLQAYLQGDAFEVVRQKGMPTRLEIAEAVDPRLATLMKVFGIGGLPGCELELTTPPRTDVSLVPAFTDPARLDFHFDSVPRVGISMLMPLSGGPARFEFRENREDTPECLTYQEGDVLLLRQNIATYNGEEVHKSQIEHRGVAGSERVIYTVDLQNRDLVTDFTI